MHGLRVSLAAAVLSLTALACSAAPGETDGEDLGSTSEALTNVCPPATNTLGIDIASFQHPNGAAIDWTKVATNRKFVIVKATEGSTYANTYYNGDVNAARAAGLIVGAYAVVAPQSKSGQTGAQQAAYFLAHSQHKPGDLPPLLDVEPFAEYGSVLPEASTVLSWLTAVETALGRKPMVYIRPDLIAALGTPAALGTYPIDVPNYSTCPGFPDAYPVKNLLMWQYTSTAAIPGINGNVDAIRFYGDLNALEAFANGSSSLPAASGYLDKVACDEIAGWDYDPNAKPKSTTVKISYNGAEGAAGATAVSYPAGNERADLKATIGSTNHGFSVLPPRSLFDGKSHSVDAYAVALETGVTGDRLTSPARALSCAALPIAAGAVKRWVTTKAIFDAWKMNAFTDIAPEPDAALGAVTKGADITAGPECVVSDDGAPEVWVIDQGKKRHVLSPASLAAWRLTATKTPAATVNGYAQGPNWPLTPELVKGSAAEVYMLDVDIDAPIAATPDNPSASTPASPGTLDDAAPADSSGGCRAARGRSASADLTWPVALGVVVGALRRRRRRAAAGVAAVLAGAPAAASAGVTHPFTGVTEVSHTDRVLVIADLCAPGVSVRATKYSEREATPTQWATKPTVNADIAVNADFFDFPGWTYVVGRARGGGEDWPAGDQNRETRSYWEFGPTIARLVEPSTTAPTAGVTEIVGAHNVLIRNGKSLAPNFDGDAVITTAHRRTAIGVDADQSHLYLFAADANLDGSGVVSSVVAMAAEGGAPPLDFLTNEDGGGSSQMYIRGQGQPIDSGRQVNNHLGILARGTGAAPMCPNHAPRGAFDAAACTTITGWAQDQDAPTTSIDVHLYFDGKPGTAGVKTVQATADVDRADLMKALGSTKHGFVVPTPYALFDGKVHHVFPYAIDTKGGTNPLLGDKTLTCTASAPVSVKRHITSPAVLAAWGFSSFVDEMPLTDAVINGFGPGVDVAAAPVLVRADDKSPEVWLVDGTMRRHVVDRDSADAWHFDLTKVVTKPAAEVNALTKGPDVLARPLLARASGGAVYLLDDPASMPPGAVVNPDGTVTVPGGPGDGSGAAAAASADGTASDAAGGCAVGRRRGWGAGSALVALFAAAAASVIAGLRRRPRS